MLEALAVYALALFLSAAANPSGAPEGYTADDPCFRCGEDWKFYPNRTIYYDNGEPYVNLPQYQETSNVD